MSQSNYQTYEMINGRSTFAFCFSGISFFVAGSCKLSSNEFRYELLMLLTI